MESDRFPAWAILPAAFKLMGASLAHPATAKKIIADPGTHKVYVVPASENGAGRKHAPTSASAAR